ncbi:cytidylyltransferase domain-containing protein [Salinibacter ruber]|uniref:cytidylyltransferase domain-containing protein n=1 Tax=Salinibacter ruber TaxID=146919 RepID=UPI0021673294|nr:hypothetical protein [Salinibacter ruber]MCS4150715.1 CMP-N-acetylneuraminic acid synthetase [Salinibacter ruber]
MLAKKDSKRLPNKNNRRISGLKMFKWNLKKMVHLLPKNVYFNSDNEKMLDEACGVGAKTIKRNKSLRGHEVPSVMLFKSMLKKIDKKVDVIVNIQANSPTCRLSKIKKMIRIAKYTSVKEAITVYPESYDYNGSLWSISKSRLNSYGDPYVQQPEVLLTDRSIDIHYQKDLEEARKKFNVPEFAR